MLLELTLLILLQWKYVKKFSKGSATPGACMSRTKAFTNSKRLGARTLTRGNCRALWDPAERSDSDQTGGVHDMDLISLIHILIHSISYRFYLFFEDLQWNKQQVLFKPQSARAVIDATIEPSLPVRAMWECNRLYHATHFKLVTSESCPRIHASNERFQKQKQ